MATVDADACSASRSSGARTRASSPAAGNYVDDVKLPGTTYAAFVRSPHAHARIQKHRHGRRPSSIPAWSARLHRQGHDRRQLAAVRLGPAQGEEDPGRRPGSRDGPHMPLTATRPVTWAIPSPSSSPDSQAAGHGRRREGAGRLGAAAGGDRHRAGARQRAPRRSTTVAPGNVAFKWEIGDAAATDAAFKGAAGHGEEAHRQPAPRRQRHGAARVRGPLRRRRRAS